MSAPLRVERAGPGGHTAVIVLNRPARGNAFTSSMRAMMVDAWTLVRTDDSIRCVVVTGTGDRHFCTGVDVAEVAKTGRGTAGDGPAAEEIVWSPFSGPVWKPVVCALNGLVAGGGLHFVADADIVVAASHVELLDPHVSIGMAGAVESVGLSHRMPLGAALRMTLCGRHYRMPAERAHQLGLVDEVVDRTELMPTAMAIASQICENSPSAVRVSKRTIWESIGRSRADSAEYAWALARSQFAHPDVAEGAAAFTERRQPQWMES
ncbi:enoyl-CoA hydratase/isomerase family protein [Desertimonas flava]|uniref:enoyl-CoA hydratase/isomerase family protein n=1 Tax=Desertimonas flava TaxID=2064846 RepID=UPI000E35027A|nr:enoyl-CoA hydratase/isomerase family protein [Desertimonas flava]